MTRLILLALLLSSPANAGNDSNARPTIIRCDYPDNGNPRCASDPLRVPPPLPLLRLSDITKNRRVDRMRLGVADRRPRHFLAEQTAGPWTNAIGPSERVTDGAGHMMKIR
jgi:hypothetical protein